MAQRAVQQVKIASLPQPNKLDFQRYAPLAIETRGTPRGIVLLEKVMAHRRGLNGYEMMVYLRYVYEAWEEFERVVQKRLKEKHQGGIALEQFLSVSFDNNSLTVSSPDGQVFKAGLEALINLYSSIYAKNAGLQLVEEKLPIDLMLQGEALGLDKMLDVFTGRKEKDNPLAPLVKTDPKDFRRFRGMDWIVGLEDLKEKVRDLVIGPFSPEGQEILEGLVGKDPTSEEKATKSLYLFAGEPGTGKTLMAEAIVKELFESGAKVAYIKITPGDLRSKWLGETEQYMDHLVDLVRELGKQGYLVVLFVDEMDALLPKRDRSHPAVSAATSRFLEMLSGASSEEVGNLLVIGTTNNLGLFDKAFLNRVEMVFFPQPDREQIRAIGKLLLTKLVNAGDRWQVSEQEIEKLSQKLPAYGDARQMERLIYSIPRYLAAHPELLEKGKATKKSIEKALEALQ